VTTPSSGDAGDHKLRPLPIRPRPIAGEGIVSYVRRLARANHLRPSYLRRYLRHPDRPGEIRLGWLAILAGRTPATLERALTGSESPQQRSAERPPGTQPARRKPGKAALFAGIRRDADPGGLSVRALADRHGVHRRTVRQALQSPIPAPRKPLPPRTSRLDPYKTVIDDLLHADRGKRPQHRRTIKAIHEWLVTQHGATGISYSTVRDYVTDRRPILPPPADAFMDHSAHEQRSDAVRQDPRDEACASANDDCPFCLIGAGPDQDIVVFRTGSIFVIPALRQRPANPGQVIVLPVDHVTALHKAGPALLTELFNAVTRITAAMPAAFDAPGSTVFQNNNTPGQSLPHLHIHVVPRFAGDGFVIPGLATEPASRRLRADIAGRLRQALG